MHRVRQSSGQSTISIFLCISSYVQNILTPGLWCFSENRTVYGEVGQKYLQKVLKPLSQVCVWVCPQQLHEDTAAPFGFSPTKKFPSSGSRASLSCAESSSLLLIAEGSARLLSDSAAWLFFRSELWLVLWVETGSSCWARMRHQGRCSRGKKMQGMGDTNVRSIPFHWSLCGAISLSAFLVY